MAWNFQTAQTPIRLIQLPLEVLWNITSFLDLISYSCFSQINHILRISVPPRADPLSESHRWLLSTKLERDYKNMLKKLACQRCKRKRPVRDFAYRKPRIGPKLFLYHRKSKILSSILKANSWLRNYNWYGMYGVEPHNQETSGRICYRHDPTFYIHSTKPSSSTSSFPFLLPFLPMLASCGVLRVTHSLSRNNNTTTPLRHVAGSYTPKCSRLSGSVADI